VQADKILSQLEQDVEVLNKNGFIDYSLFMIVVLRPFKNVEHFKPSTLGVSQFDEVRDQESGSFNSKQSAVHKRLFIGEVDQRMIQRTDNSSQPMMLLKEMTKNRTKIFHICDSYDIASIKAQREMDEGGASKAATSDGKRIADQSSERDDTMRKIAEEEKESSAGSKKQGQIMEEGDDEEDHPLRLGHTNTLKHAHAIPGSLQVINFAKSNLCYEFSSKHLDAVELAKSVINAGAHSKNPETIREQQLMKRAMGLAQPKSLMQ